MEAGGVGGAWRGALVFPLKQEPDWFSFSLFYEMGSSLNFIWKQNKNTNIPLDPKHNSTVGKKEQKIKENGK